MIFHVGIDDTDSKEGMCTTYVGAIIIDRLKELEIEPLGYPHLIRLNPNWKWKTRGNCSVSFRVDIAPEDIPKVKDIALEKVEELAELHIEETTPGVAFLEGEIPEELKTYSKKAVQKVVTMEEAIDLAEKIGAEIHRFREGRGIIGALAAIGHPLNQDWTYELIAYRIEKNRGTPRKIVPKSVRKLDEITYPNTFDNLDQETGEIRITPHTPCPILYGIRSDKPEPAEEAHKIVETEEPIERTLLYKTNQATDEHLQYTEIEEVEPYESVIVDGTVSKAPETITGGHVFFSIENESEEIKCAAFEPTRRFRDIIRKLVPGDKVRAYGGIKEKPEFPLTINLEKIEVLELKKLKRKENPTCGNCNKKMTSAGKDKGYVCKKCGTRLPEEASKVIEIDRDLERKIYEVPPRARRHLAKPQVREENK